MIGKGIVREIQNSGVFIEAFSSDSTDGAPHCSSGSCEHCSHKGKTRLIEAEKPESLSLRVGSLIEFEIPSGMVLTAVLRILILPPVLFAIFFYLIGGTAGTITGISALAAAVAVNLLLGKKSSGRERPVILREI